MLSLRAPLNFEARSSYTLAVTADDGGEPALADAAVVSITVMDVNEPPSVAAAVRSIHASSAVGALVGAPIEATDEDLVRLARWPPATALARVPSADLDAVGDLINSASVLKNYMENAPTKVLTQRLFSRIPNFNFVKMASS